MMNKRLLTFVMLSTLAGCIQNPFSDEQAGRALVRSNYPILSINGKAPDDVYRAGLSTGEQKIAVQYRTLSKTYICEFVWQVNNGQVYEVVRDRQKEPLTLYLWTRVNALWASRTQAVAPRQCQTVGSP